MMTKGWKSESARHSMAKKFGKAPPYKEKPKKVQIKKYFEAYEGTLRGMFPYAYYYLNAFLSEEQKKILRKISVRILLASSEDYGLPKSIDGESDSKTKTIKIYAKHPKWKEKVRPRNIYQNKVIVHEAMHIIKDVQAGEFKYKEPDSSETIAKWKKLPEEKVAIHFEKKFLESARKGLLPQMAIAGGMPKKTYNWLKG